jgi:hypothetical protein
MAETGGINRYPMAMASNSDAGTANRELGKRVYQEPILNFCNLIRLNVRERLFFING